MKTVRTKIEFMAALENELKIFGVSDRSEIISDFTLHFSASAGEGLSEAEICEKLGDVSEIARQYADDYVIPETGESPTPELIFPDPTATYVDSNAGKSPLVLDDFGDAKEIEELIKAAPVYPDAENKSWQSETASSPQEQNIGSQNNQNNQSYQSHQSTGNYEKSGINLQDVFNNFKNSANFNNYSANFNVGGLIGALCVDLFVFSWAIPALFGVVIGLLSIPIALIGSGLGISIDGIFSFFNVGPIFSGGNWNWSLFGFAGNTVNGLAGIFLGVIMLCLGALSVMLGIKLVKLCINVVKGIINWHGKMIIGRPVIQKKPKKV